MARDTVRALVLDQGPGLWGAQKYLLRLRPGLGEHGVELTLGCPPQLEQYRHWRDRDLPVVALDLPTDRSIRDDGRISLRRTASEIRRSALTPRLIATTVRRGGFDVVLANSHWTHLDAALAARRWRIPTVLTLHETPVPGTGSALRNLAIAAAHQTVAVSESVAATVGPRVRGRVTVIPNGVDTSVFSPSSNPLAGSQLRAELGLSAERPILLAATRLDPSKHIEDLIELARAVGDRATLLIAGNTSNHPDYEAQMIADAADLPKSALIFLGARVDIAALLGAADLFGHTGLVEGMPLGLVEAQASGVPVVAYEAAGVREALLDNESGFVVAPRDRAGLVRAVTALLDSHTARHDFSAAARRHAVAHHRIDDQAAANAGLLRALAHSAPRTLP